MWIDRHSVFIAVVPPLCVLSVLTTGCPDDGDGPTADAAPASDTSIAEGASDAEPNSGYCWDQSRKYFCDMCTQDDGAQFLAVGIMPRALAIEGDRGWFIDDSYDAALSNNTTLLTMGLGRTVEAPVATLTGVATGIEQYGGQLYWPTHGMPVDQEFELGTVGSMPTSGTIPTTLVQGNVSGMVVTPKGLVVGRLDRLQLVSFDGSTSTDLVAKSNAYCAFAANEDTVVWLADSGCVTVRAASLSGGQPRDLGTVPYSYTAAADSTYGYVSTQQGLFRVPLAGGALESLSTADYVSFAVGGGWLYWTESSVGQQPPLPILRRRTDGDTVEQVAAEKNSITILRVDESYVYFSEFADSSSGAKCIKRKAH